MAHTKPRKRSTKIPAGIGKKRGFFTHMASRAASWSGSSYAFILAFSTILIWLVTGPLFGYSDTWQLVINTGTTIVTFLMVFLIQNAQNRDTKALQLKLDELIRATGGAHTVLLDLEELEEKELEAIACKYREIARVGREHLRAGKDDTDIPQVVLDAAIL